MAVVFIVRTFAEPIRKFIDEHTVWGLCLYVSLNIVDAVAAQGATLSLIPVAARVLGPVAAALATTAGWTAGRFIPEDLFWSIVFVRLVLPMDVISYVLGLFTDIRWATYVGATALGLTPSAVLLAYVGKLPNGYLLITAAIEPQTSPPIVDRFRRPRLITWRIGI